MRGIVEPLASMSVGAWGLGLEVRTHRVSTRAKDWPKMDVSPRGGLSGEGGRKGSEWGWGQHPGGGKWTLVKANPVCLKPNH